MDKANVGKLKGVKVQMELQCSPSLQMADQQRAQLTTQYTRDQGSSFSLPHSASRDGEGQDTVHQQLPRLILLVTKSLREVRSLRRRSSWNWGETYPWS